MQLTGTGFESGATVTFGGVTVAARFDSREPLIRTLFVKTPAHAAGAVDVVVTNPSGKSGSLTAGYNYVSPASFDFNGTWSGFGDAGQDLAIGFTIQNDVLVSVTCDLHPTLTFAPPPAVTNGEFSSFDGGVGISGRIVSPSAATGRINIAPCANTIWNATRQ